jgi:hypothetical protein
MQNEYIDILDLIVTPKNVNIYTEKINPKIENDGYIFLIFGI